MKYSAANNAMMVELNRQYKLTIEASDRLNAAKEAAEKDCLLGSYECQEQWLAAMICMAESVARAQGFRLRKRASKGFDLVEIDPT